MRGIGQRAGALARLLAAVLVVFLAGVVVAERQSAWGQESHPAFLIVAHPEHGSLTVERRFLADAFLKKRTTWPDGASIYPVDQRFDAPVRAHFSKQVLRRSVQAVRNYWQQRIFAGRGVPPAELESDELVIRHVLKHPGAVGYVSSRAATEKVKVLNLR